MGNWKTDSKSKVLLGVYPNNAQPNRYIVFNSGFTFREYDHLNNARQIPMLPDWALVSVVEGRGSQLPGTILAEGFFDEAWRPSPRTSWGRAETSK